MPPLGLALGGVDFSDKAIVLRAATETDPGVAIKYGVFINTVIDFTIVALAVFVLVKAINTMQQAAGGRAAARTEPGGGAAHRDPGRAARALSSRATRSASSAGTR